MHQAHSDRMAQRAARRERRALQREVVDELLALRPPMLESLGVPTTLEELLERFLLRGAALFLPFHRRELQPASGAQPVVGCR
jgi:hypothetical protein